MKVLWLCNVMLPAFARTHDLPYTNREGWLSGSYERMVRDRADDSGEGNTSARDIELGVCFPAPYALGNFRQEQDSVIFYGFLENLDTPEVYDHTLEKRFQEILNDFQPDIVHIFGTEFPHTLAMIQAFHNPDRILLGIQGLCSVIAEKYMADLPVMVQKDATFRDKLKKDSLVQQQEKYRRRAAMENASIRMAGHITGRTDFDRRVTASINPKAVYHHMNETMRSCFYTTPVWKRENSVPYSIFLPQGDYPIKGFHYMLQALPKLIAAHPQTHVYVAGNSIIGRADRSSVTAPGDRSSESGGSRYPLFIRISAYGRYLRLLMVEKHLKKHVTVLGKLSAEQMKEQYLKCSVFACPSAVENSPNSVGEAMLLGVPVVASRTGGIPSMVDENHDGILFEAGNADALAAAIMQIWDEGVIADVFGENARKHALRTHDADLNYARLLEIYRAINASAGKNETGVKGE
ncbi:MAG: glycosyltransferase family 4 protein [Butyrivibrio sp.]|jgi:glycosyltransferase involved in cell wall biosynthesis|nr:glycosyltransferase family 4 protein [Butyrivibrio sp.]